MKLTPFVGAPFPDKPNRKHRKPTSSGLFLSVRMSACVGCVNLISLQLEGSLGPQHPGARQLPLIEMFCPMKPRPPVNQLKQTQRRTRSHLEFTFRASISFTSDAIVPTCSHLTPLLSASLRPDWGPLGFAFFFFHKSPLSWTCKTFSKVGTNSW